jgi:hypothetical protein
MRHRKKADMQATRIRRIGFNGLLILVVAFGVLAGAIAIAASNIDVLPWTDRDGAVIERSAPVSRPTDARSLDGQLPTKAPGSKFRRPTDASSIGGPDSRQAPSTEYHWPTDRP